MNTPFTFGKIVTGNEFTNREKETIRLENNFLSGINSILISPRRWGKTSLVIKASQKAAKTNIKLKVCSIDLFNIRSEEQFYEMLTQEVIKASTTKWRERIENTKQFISRFIPKITYSPDLLNEFAVGLDWKEVKKNSEDILNLAEKIAKERKIKFLICIDEFQNIAEFENPIAFQKKLRSNWQNHQNTTYCLYGSKRHMMMNVFTNASMPFYKFGDILFLEKIAEKYWDKFIQKRFNDTNKSIDSDNAKLIAQLADYHPYYVQQLAQQTWLHTIKKSNKATVNQSLDNIIMQLSLLFQNITDNLTNSQVNLLKAITDNAKALSSKETLNKYNLGTSANVLRIKEALVNKEIIDIQNGQITFSDPMYNHWLKKYYFKN